MRQDARVSTTSWEKTSGSSTTAQKRQDQRTLSRTLPSCTWKSLRIEVNCRRVNLLHDKYKILGNSPPTLPFTRYFSLSVKVGSKSWVLLWEEYWGGQFLESLKDASMRRTPPPNVHLELVLTFVLQSSSLSLYNTDRVQLTSWDGH